MKHATHIALILLLSSPVVAQTTDTVNATQPGESQITAAQIAALRAQLDGLLLPSGMPIQLDENHVDTKLIDLAAQSGELSRRATDQQQQLDANNIELRSYNALANNAIIQQRRSDADFRVAQLRITAQQTRQLAAPQASLTGSFWLLNADLIDIRQNIPDLADQQLRAIERIEAFLERSGQEDDEAGRVIVTDVQLGLLRLYEQAGQSRQACTLLGQLDESLAGDDPRRDQLAASVNLCSRIGQPLAFSLAGQGDQTWDSSADLGRPVLLYLAASTAMPSEDSLGTLYRHSQLHQPKAHLYLIAVGPSGDYLPPARWRFSSVDTDDPLLKNLGTTSLPQLVLLDERGQVAALGCTRAIVVQPVPPESPAPPRTEEQNHQP